MLAQAYGNQQVDACQRTLPVRSFSPNDWGLYDIHGNVEEWVQDWLEWDYYSVSPVNDPGGPATGTAKVIRGGSWYNHTKDCRSAKRSYLAPGYRHLGFRLLSELS